MGDEKAGEADLLLNDLVDRSAVIRNPRLIIEFRGERWGHSSIRSYQELLDGLCYANFVALRDIPRFLEENRGESVRLVHRESGQALAWTLAELQEMCS